MFDGDTNVRYNGRPISDILAEQALTAPKLGPHNDFTVYLMGPYTAFNAEKSYADETFGSATIDELAKRYDIHYDRFDSKEELPTSVRRWFDNIIRET